VPSEMATNPAVEPEVAFYYPGHIWLSGDWIKNLILFFDGIALLVPSYAKDRPELVDPYIATPMREQGLLHIIEPETVVDKIATEKLATAMTDVITSGALDPLAQQETRFRELSYSRLGGHGDRELAEMILEELKSKGLARDSEDGVSIPMHPMVRWIILVLLAQILRPYGEELGLDLSPTTDRSQLIHALNELLSLPATPSRGHVISSDLATVGIDLGPVPMDEILSFRQEHLREYKAYTRSVRSFVRDLSLMPEEDRTAALLDRREELDERAQDLKSLSKGAWKRPASFALGITGAAWTLTTGDPIGALIGASTVALGAAATREAETGAYSYIFRAAQRYA
jgi:hypothetical protein